MKSANGQVPGFPELKWGWYTLKEMEPFLLYDMLALREAIFVVEQSCIYQELDGQDKTAKHLLVLQTESPVACLRVLPGADKQNQARIGRVAVSKRLRKQGLARLMVEEAVDRVHRDFSGCGIALSAQTYLKDFYESLGFRICGDEYLEDGIPHIPMQL